MRKCENMLCYICMYRDEKRNNVRPFVSKIKIINAIITNPLTSPTKAPKILSALGSSSGSSI